MADEERFDSETAYDSLVERMDALDRRLDEIAAEIQKVYTYINHQIAQQADVRDRQIEITRRDIERRMSR